MFRWTASIPDAAMLLAWTSDGRSLWVERNQDRGAAWWVDAAGAASKPVQFADVRSQGTQLSASPGLDLVISRWMPDALEVEIVTAR